MKVRLEKNDVLSVSWEIVYEWLCLFIAVLGGRHTLLLLQLWSHFIRLFIGGRQGNSE